MGNHPFNVIVILFWLATMSWLFVAKVLPPLRVGEPPSYSSMARESREEPVCWSVRLNDQNLGWAATKVVRRKDGITELFSRVYLRDLPVDEIAPPWLGKALKPLLRQIGPLDVDKRSRLTLDPLGRLVSLDCKVRIADIADAIKVTGVVEGSSLSLSVQSGDFQRKLEQFLPADALIADEFSPQANMPGLRLGQTWTVPLYNPFHPPSTPVEVLQAVVERDDHLTWGGRLMNTRVIVYRSDPGSGLVSNDPRGRMWVAEDGVVLRQEMNVFRSHVHFIRLAADQTEAITSALAGDWMVALPAKRAKRLLDEVQAIAP